MTVDTFQRVVKTLGDSTRLRLLALLERLVAQCNAKVQRNLRRVREEAERQARVQRSEAVRQRYLREEPPAAATALQWRCSGVAATPRRRRSWPRPRRGYKTSKRGAARPSRRGAGQP